MSDETAVRVAAFVSPHGFGHAARCSAVLAELEAAGGGAVVDLFTTAPRWFFRESLGGEFRYHPTPVDVGFVQKSALEVDLPGTVEAAQALVPFDGALVRALADEVRSRQCDVVLCDIAPLGVAVAEEAGLPSVLLENFSWPWLYEPFLEEAPGLEAVGLEIDRWTKRATVHVQARPVCARDEAFEVVDPISRRARRPRDVTRESLGVDHDGSLVVVTMGGYGEAYDFLDSLRSIQGVSFLITGAHATGVEGNLHLFDNNTPLYMPDVLRASDAVVAKLGYGTVAEVWAEGIPFAHVTRSNFREMASLEAFAAEELNGFLLSGDHFLSGSWVERVPQLLEMDRRPHDGGGAKRVADIVRASARQGRSGHGPMRGSVTPTT
jgi:hypothetical protein